MKWRSLFTASGMILAGFLAACNGGSGQTSTTAVTVAVGTVKAAHKAGIYSKATPTVASITFTISGPGMETVSRSVPVTPPQTINEVFYILNGPDRNFFIEARDESGKPVYSGGMLADLDGTPLVVTLPLQALIFNDLIWTPWADEATAIAKDPSGNMIIAGHTYGDLGAANADATHKTPDVFVTKLTSTGGRLWTTQVGTTGMDICYGAATDSAGNVYVAGTTDGNLNGKAKSGQIDAFVMKLDSAGALIWTRLTGTAGALTLGNNISVDAAGNAYVTGYTDASLDVIQNPNTGTFDAFVVKFDAGGTHQWTHQFGSTASDYGEGIAVDSTGRIAVSGSTRGDLGGTGNAGLSDLFVAAYDVLDGAQLWVRQLGSTDDDDARAVAVDPATGDIYAAGGTYGGLDSKVNANTDINKSTSDLFVVKYDSTGVKQWAEQLGSTENDTVAGIVLDSGGNVVVTGRTNGVLDTIPGDGLNDVFVVKYDSTGAKLWTQELGTKADDEGIGIIAGAGDSLTVVGNTFGGFTSFPTEDVFLVMYDASGNKLENNGLGLPQ